MLGGDSRMLTGGTTLFEKDEEKKEVDRYQGWRAGAVLSSYQYFSRPGCIRAPSGKGGIWETLSIERLKEDRLREGRSEEHGTATGRKRSAF